MDRTSTTTTRKLLTGLVLFFVMLTADVARPNNHVAVGRSTVTATEGI